LKAEPEASKRELTKRGTAKRPDDLVKIRGAELTEIELSGVSGGITGESTDAKHKD